MKRWAVAAGLVLAVGCAPTAAAEPAPQPGATCDPELAGVMTQLPDGTTFLVCQGVWAPVTPPFNPSDRWLSYGPALALHGQGRRNPEVTAGQWVGTPRDGGSCVASQEPVTDAGPGAAVLSTGQPGAALDVEVPVAFAVTLSGDCLWQRSSSIDDEAG